MKKIIIDCSLPPKQIDGLNSESHTENSFKGNLDLRKIRLIELSEAKRLRNENNKIFPNSNALEELLKNPETIPGEWDEFGIIFLGTTYYSEEDHTITVCGICHLHREKENEWVMFSNSMLNLFPVFGDLREDIRIAIIDL